MLTLLAGLLVVAGSTTLLKAATGRLAPAVADDPFGAGGQSLSGHTAAALVEYGVLALVLTGPDGIISSRLRGRLFAGVGLLGATTGVGVVLKGYYWPSDSVGGYLLGAALLALASLAVPGASNEPGDGQAR